AQSLRTAPPTLPSHQGGPSWTRHQVCFALAVRPAERSMSETNGSAAVPSPAVEGALATGRTFRPVVLAAITVALIALCAYLGWPFLSAVTWALALAVIAWPMHERIARHVRWPGLAAGLTSVLVFLLVL